MSNTTTTPSHEPWARRPDEPTRWFARFERFRLLGPTRSLRAVVRGERSGRQKATKGDSIPAAWSAAVAKWEWRQRADAWDSAELEREARLHAAWQRKARKRRLKLFDALGRKLRKAVAEALVEGLPVNVLAGAVKATTEAERAEFAADNDGEGSGKPNFKMVDGFEITRRDGGNESDGPIEPITRFEIVVVPDEPAPGDLQANGKTVEGDKR